MSQTTSAGTTQPYHHGIVSLYGYVPGLAAAGVFLALFSILTIAHSALVIRSRIWWLSLFVVGGIAEITGWAGRAFSNKKPINLNGFLVQVICLILAPCFFSAAIYGITGLLIKVCGPQHSRLRPNLYMWFFCIADLVAIVIQAVGGAMAAIALQTNKSSVTGTHIMVVGIVLQLVSMIVFCLLTLDFYLKARRDPLFTSRASLAQRRIDRLIYGVFFGSFFILLRCIYRTIELAQGWTGYLITREGYFLGLDSVPMVLTMAVFLWSHPYFCIERDGVGRGSEEEKVMGEEGSPAGSFGMEKRGSELEQPQEVVQHRGEHGNQSTGADI